MNGREMELKLFGHFWAQSLAKLLGGGKFNIITHYHQLGWIGTVEVIRNTGLKLGESFCLSVSSGLSPMSQFTFSVPIHPNDGIEWPG